MKHWFETWFESFPTTPAQSPTLPSDHKSLIRFGLEKHGHPLEKRRWNVLKSDLERENGADSDGQIGCTLTDMILRISVYSDIHVLSSKIVVCIRCIQILHDLFV